MIVSRQQQRGAVTLVGALFIVVVLSVMAVSLLRMAGSNILDSAMHNDAVEALFVAETGVEHASYRYANTANCAGLDGVGPVNAGRGSFALSVPLVQPVVGCRVRVTASVGSAGNDPAVRTADIDLRLGLPGQAWAVGKNGELFLWDGAAWTAYTPSPAKEKMNAITCPTTNECWAVGDNGEVLHYTAGTWTRSTVGASENYEDIACAPNNPDYCFLVGKDGGGIIRFWDGSGWSNPTTKADGLKDNLQAVTCPSNTCYAVGKKKQPPLRFDGASWLEDGVTDVSKDLTGVHCFSVTGCWAVGDRQKDKYTFARRSSSPDTWQQIQVASDLKKPDLESVYCLSADDCWAVGNRSKPENDYTVARLVGGIWSTWPTPSLGKGEDLKDISCASATDCFAVGKKGSVLHWNGSAWSDASSAIIDNTNLEGVAFLGGAASGTVTLTRWQEIIGN